MILELFKLLHILNEIFMASYIFIFRTNKYDIIFISYVFLIAIHWLFLKNECLLSVIEKKLLDKNYEIGKTPNEHPYQNYISPIFLKIIRFMKFFNIFFILCRNIKNIYIVLMISVITIIQLRYEYSAFIQNKETNK